MFLLNSVFPNLARVVKARIPAVVDETRKFDAFMKFGQFTKDEAVKALQPGFGPDLIVKNWGYSWGHYPDAGDDIWISEWLAQQYEMVFESRLSADGQGQVNGGERERWLRLVKHATLVVESTILHETVHWGDAKDGSTGDRAAWEAGWKDLGHMFVKEAYGDAFSYFKEKKSGLEHRAV